MKWTLNDSHVSLYLHLAASYRLKFRVGEAERKKFERRMEKERGVTKGRI